MVTQRQPVQVFQHPQRDLAHGAVADPREHRVAQFVEQRTGQPQQPVAEQQAERQHQQRCLAVQRIDDLLEQQRDTDVGDLGQHQGRQGQGHPAAVFPQERGQRLHGPEVPAAGAGQFRVSYVHRDQESGSGAAAGVAAANRFRRLYRRCKNAAGPRFGWYTGGLCEPGYCIA